MRILWLCSWYPNKLDPFDGDFIQRQARAAALYHDIHVLHIRKATFNANETKITGRLTEQIVYYKATDSLLGKLRYISISRKQVNNYIEQHGKPDLVHVHVPIKAGITALWLKRKFNIPFLLTEHYAIYNNLVPDRFTNRSAPFRHYTKRIIVTCLKFLPVSRELGEAINKYVTAKPFTVISNAVDTNYFNFTTPPQTTFRFIHISNMVPRKNVHLIIDAIQQLNASKIPCELLLVGPSSPEITSKSNTHVIFTGEIPYEAVASQIKSSHALVLFSQFENMPCVILESLCCGRPVISNRVGGISEVINEYNGMLTDNNSSSSLTEAMKSMITNYNNYNLQKISQQAMDSFSFETIGEQLSEVYKNSGA